MKVLVVTHKDGPNLFMENTVKKLIDTGHDVSMYAMFNDEQSLRMFSDLDLEIKDLSELNEEIVTAHDFIFCPSQAVPNIDKWNKYIFSFCNMNPHFDHVRGSDFVFTLGEIREDYPGTYATMAVGNTKNDIAPSEEGKHDTGRMLFVDTGHFPFSKKGKQQVAELILEICRKFPDRKLTVKPRWMPDTPVEAMTHINNIHIYDVLKDITGGNLPDNLELLYEHENLQELIDSSDVVITLCTTAFLDVALRGKPLIVVSGIENEDTYHLRSDYFDNVYKYAEESGCVVDFREVTDHLPEGIYCNEAFLDDAFYAKEGASERTIEVMDFINRNFLVDDEFPEIKQYDYETYRTLMKADPDLDYTGLKRLRLYCRTETLFGLNKSISQSINWTPLEENCKAACMTVNISKSAKSRLYKLIISMKCNFIIDHKEDMYKNDVDMDYYFYALYYSNNYETLIHLYETEDHNISLSYYAGMSYLHRKNFKKAFDALSHYYELLKQDRSFVKFREERKSVIVDGLSNLIMLSFFLFKFKNASEIIDFVMHGTMYQFDSKSIYNFLIGKKIKSRISAAKGAAKNKKRALRRKGRSLVDYGRHLYHQARRRMFIRNSKKGNLNENQMSLQILKDVYAGKKAFVIGNGSSLTAEDLEKISRAGYITFASNKIYKIYSQTSWRPDVYACFDKLMFTQNQDEILENLCGYSFLNASFQNLMNNEKISGNTRFLHYIFPEKDIDFSDDVKYFFNLGSVTYGLLQLAYFMGIREVYLIGCDHYYKAFEGKKNYAIIKAEKRTNRDYCTKDYVSPGEMIKIQNLKKSANAFAYAASYYENNGGHVYNATRGGMLETLPRTDIDQLISAD